MNSENGKIGFSIELDNTQLNKDIKRSQQAFSELGNNVEAECSKIDNAFGGIGRTIASIGAAWSLQELAKKIATIRGEFQALEKTMEVMLQSKSKAEALMNQMVETAATTPFGLQEVAGGAKQLLAYGLEAEKINETLIRLGNIASGLSIPLGDLIYLYGTTMAQGRLYTQDLNQFTGRGIPMLAELAKQFDVAESEVKGLVEAGKVGFPEVQKVIESLTNEGGKFYNLMGEQSQLINGKISNLEDAFDSMFNEIGENNEGLINGTIDSALWLVENYEAVGTALMTLVADYGVYKATLMAMTAYTNACYTFEIAQLQAVVGSKAAEMDADLASAVLKGRMTAQRAAEVQALRNEVAAKMEAAVVTDRIAQAELAQARAKFESFQVTVALSKMRVTQAQQELAAAQASGNAVAIENAKVNLNTAIAERNSVARQSSILKRNMETAATNANAAAQARQTLATKADTAAKKINATTTSLLTLVTHGLKNAFNSLKAAMATNPFGIALVAITSVIGVLMTLNNTMSETSEEVKRFGESAVNQTRNVETLLAVINNTSRTSKVHKDAVEELSRIYEDYGIKIDDERSKLDQLNEMREEVIRLLRLEGEERQKADTIASYDKALDKAGENMRAKLQESLQNAEWEDSGFFDDWDHTSVQRGAAQLTEVLGAIIESEAEKLAGLTGDAYNAQLKKSQAKIEEAMTAMGYATKREMNVMSEAGEYTITQFWDVDTKGMLEEHANSIGGIVTARNNLINSYKNSGETITKETEAIDLATLSFDKLFEAAYNASGAISNIGNITTYVPGQITSSDTEQQEALGELDKRMITAIKTRKGTSDLLQNVNKALETVEAGTENERILLAMQRRLQEQLNKFKSNVNTAEQIASIEKAEQDTLKAIEQSSKQRQEMERKLHFQEEQNRINLERDASVRKREQMRLDHEKELYDLEQQEEAAIKAEKQRQKAIFDAQENEKKARNKNYVKQNFTDDLIDQSQITAIEQQYNALREQQLQLQRNETSDMWRSEFEAMQDYLQDYGSFQQQKLAIATEYAEKIRKAQNEGERLSLTRERDSKLAGIEAKELKANIDWTVMFGEFGNMFTEVTRPILEDAKAYMQTDEFKNSDHASQQALVEAVQQMEQSLGGTDKVSFAKLGKDIETYQKSMLKLRTAQNEYERSYKALIDAQNAYTEALENGTEAEQEAAESALNTARDNEAAASQNVEAIQLETNAAQSTMSNTANTLKTSMDGVVEGLQKMASVGSLSGIYEGFKGLATSLGEMKGKFAEAFQRVSDGLEKVPIIGWIIAIIDIFKDGLSVVVGGILDAVFSAISGIIGDILNFKDGFFRTLGESLFTGIMSIFKSIFTLGGWFDWWGNGESDPELEKDIELLTASNEALQRSIDNLTDVMEGATMEDAAKLYERQKELLDESEANTQEMMARSGAAWSNGFLGVGGTKSTNRKINDGMSEDDWKRMSDITETTISSAADFFNLTSEQMRQIAMDAPDLYAKIKGLADDGYKDAGQYMDDYIEYAKQREELDEAYREKMTNVSFDSLRDEFKNALMDMEMSAADFANNFNKLLVDSIAESLMTEKYDKDIKALYAKWAGFMESDGKLTDEELAELQKDKEAIYASMEQDRQFLNDIAEGGSSSSQDSTKQGFEGMSQDTADELNGRFTAIQMDTSSIREMMMQYGIEMSHVKMSTAEIRQHTEEMRNLSLTAIDHLDTISRNTHELFEINERLGKIEKNTRNL
ncbi:MAG: hypothetical protein IKU16_06045 [Muribaculaceae bacterium]|nr:hypothetical protein [Muribaculaceae bacterium]